MEVQTYTQIINRKQVATEDTLKVNFFKKDVIENYMPFNRLYMEIKDKENYQYTKLVTGLLIANTKFKDTFKSYFDNEYTDKSTPADDKIETKHSTEYNQKLIDIGLGLLSRLGSYNQDTILYILTSHYPSEASKMWVTIRPIWQSLQPKDNTNTLDGTKDLQAKIEELKQQLTALESANKIYSNNNTALKQQTDTIKGENTAFAKNNTDLNKAIQNIPKK